MSELNYLEKLLDGAEVEWLPLGVLGELVRGNGLPKTDFTEAGIPAIHYGQIYTFYGLSTETTKSFVSQDTAKKLKKVNTGDVVITNTSENLDDVGKALVYLGKEQAVTGGHATIFKPNKGIIGKYFAYFTQTNSFFNEKRKYSKGTKVIDVSASDMAKITIPIPCPNNPEKSLAIQSEIVRILDKFTELTAELTAKLTAELTLRKKQYNYYRDKLLSFEECEVEWKTLGEIAAYSKSRISFDKLDKNNYVGVDNLLQNRAGKMQSNYVPTSGNLTKFREGDILIGNIRPYLKKIWQADSTGGTNGDVLVIRSCHNSILSRYLYQILADDNFFEYNMQHAKGAKMPRGNKDAIMKYRVPIPSFDEQTRIVTILDKFDRLTNSISEGLPREIELRQKQYEYYRDLLFSFPKPEATSN
ncbi:restriction endonuclease subunit S [Klebsiella pneumoniae]|uniref:restriction endonuclease subunit S n=1 Tax=Klebsiella pneumoniae TaxID=573 RepID=UPI000F668B18|nr:restriction endonuclease subunit S [Klebsiella pneumoniae]EKX7881904.1 restriction endonuclease subunit S [Klebsiella pneumoniae]RRY67178.1 restriction endonuclease subunit S [Klebsiella pneumoniae]RRY72822.1 restriction endonuclease subunit S [Klebsiella pneumoniae]RRZ05239.1 restriction endonuclease subunit S [Klebsiella pneumoniae]RRZ21075.1 restriction endonuclease subunit S [Klebsiella pneumoniae]